MTVAMNILHRLGLSAPQEPDAFDLRLARMERRESSIQGRAVLFRNRPKPSVI